MTILSPLQMLVLALILWALVLLALSRGGLLERYDLGLLGPILLVRTGRGRGLVERIASVRRFWRAYGAFARGLTYSFMVLIFLLLVWEAVIATSLPPEAAPRPEVLIGLPGINPLIPVGYGIVALGIAIVVHEGGHAIQMRAHDIALRSMGLVMLVLPIGAFVEPDERQLLAAPRRDRERIFAAGPATNVVVAFLCAGVFAWGFMGALAPADEGVMVTSVSEGWPAHRGGIVPGDVLTALHPTDPNATRGGTIQSRSGFSALLSERVAGEQVRLEFVHKGTARSVVLTLADRFDYYAAVAPDLNTDSNHGKGFLGVSTLDHGAYASSLARPMGGVLEHPEQGLGKAFFFVLQPVLGLQPMPQEVADLYVISGPLAILGPGGFWMLANTFYWLFWLNLMVGLTNALPFKPLDGGYMFQDRLRGALQRVRPKSPEEETAAMARRLSLYFSIFGLILILWQIIGPRVGGLLG